MNRMLSLVVPLAICVASTVDAAPTATTIHGPENTSLAAYVSSNDLLHGLIATELAGDAGWHPANPAAGNPAAPEGLATFTDGVNNIDLFGLLNDFPPAGAPTKRIQYALSSPSDIRKIQILSGNNGKDGRVFSTSVVQVSTNGGGSFSTLGYFQSDLSGTINSGQWGSTLVSITDDAGGPLAQGVTHLIFDLYAVDNSQGEMRDPFDGVNPFTGVDDLLNAPISSPLIWEIDVFAVPEPSSLAMLTIVAVGASRLRRRRR